MSTRFTQLGQVPPLTARRLEPEPEFDNSPSSQPETADKGPELRRSPRTAVEKIVCLHLDADNHAIVLNISEGGLAFHAVKPVVAEHALEFTLSLPNHQRIQAKGELVWRDETKKTAGLRFTFLEPEAREELRRWLLQTAVAASPLIPTERSFANDRLPPAIPTPQPVAPAITAALRVPATSAFAAPASAAPGLKFPATSASAASLSAASPDLPAGGSSSQVCWPHPEYSSPLLSGGTASRNRLDQLPSEDSRPSYFRGFLTGALVVAVAVAALLFADGRQVAEYLAQLRGAAEAEVMPQSAPQPVAPSIASTGATAPDLATPQPVAPPIGSAPATAPDLAAPTPAAPSAVPPAKPSENPRAAEQAESAPQPPAAAAAAPASSIGAARAGRDAKRIVEPPRAPAGNSATPAGNSATIDSRNRASSQPSDDTGGTELAIAQDYLRKRGGAADGASLAYLWSAVEKGNVAAELKLADLYARGDGVARSCDQARVLLDAAASKGSYEADQQLAEIARSRCH